MVRVSVREQNPKVRATNIEEVCFGYNEKEAYENHIFIDAVLILLLVK